MKLRILIIAALGLSVGHGLAEQKPAADKPALKPEFRDEQEQFSYALGMNYGTFFNRQEIELNLETMMKGLKDSISSNKTLLTEEEMRAVLTDAQRKNIAKRDEKRKLQGEENKKKADEFLAQNKAKDGVKTTETGLQYKVLTEGSGAPPGSNDTVTVNYKGSLQDGTEFDSSYKRGQPATFSINGVINGWKEALHLMKAGAKWQLFIPPNLAYGERPPPNAPIPPNSLLIFEVELLSNTAPAVVQSPSQPLTSDIIKVPSLEEMKKGAKIETIKSEDVDKEIKKQQEKKQ